VIRLSDGHAIAVLRFDRLGNQRIHRLSAGTAISAASIPGSDPEFGYPELARLLRRLGVTDQDANEKDARELFRRMVFNILMDNTDDHEKNHSLLVLDPFGLRKMRLAPAYDVLPTNSGQGYLEFICGDDARDSTLQNAMSQCDAFGLSAKEAALEVVGVIEVVNTWQSHFDAAGVSVADIESLQQRIDGDVLLSQRAQFDPERFSNVPKKKSTKNPFS